MTLGTLLKTTVVLLYFLSTFSVPVQKIHSVQNRKGTSTRTYEGGLLERLPLYVVALQS